MTLQQLFDTMAGNPMPVIIYFVMLPLTAFIVGLVTDDNEGYESPWKYLYSTIIYLVCLPGIFAVTMCIYHLLIDQKSFLQLNVLAYFLPILSMIVTLLIISKNVEIQYIPGFDKIGGLSMVIAATFITILIIQKTRIWIFFSGSVSHLGFLFLILFVVFKWGTHKLFSGKSDSAPRNRQRSIDIN